MIGSTKVYKVSKLLIFSVLLFLSTLTITNRGLKMKNTNGVWAMINFILDNHESLKGLSSEENYFIIRDFLKWEYVAMDEDQILNDYNYYKGGQ